MERHLSKKKGICSDSKLLEIKFIEKVTLTTNNHNISTYFDEDIIT